MGFRLDNHKEVSQVLTLENNTLKIMNWGSTNSYPQTIKNLIEQSPSAKPATSRYSKFLMGGSFEGEDIVVGLNGITLKDIVQACAEDYSVFEGFCIHSNWNLEGRVKDMSVLQVPTIRFNTFDHIYFSNKYAYHQNFALNSEVKKTNQTSVTIDDLKWIDRWNPDPNIIDEQIKNSDDGTISTYNGQLLYYSNAGRSRYPIPPLQSQINFVLSDIENSILIRKETSTGFIDTYLFKTTKDHKDPAVVGFQDAIIEAQGARGVGKIISMYNLTDEEMQNTLLERIDSDKASIIDSSSKAFELTNTRINSAIMVPPALAGIDQNSGFSGADLEEAYNVFNAITESGRNVIESKINEVLKYGDFGISSIKLNPLKLSLKGETSGDGENKDEAVSSTITNLTGRQFQGIERIVKRYRNKDNPLTLEAARLLLKDGFGFNEDAADSFLIEKKEEQDV
jgi:hypothetical protein